MPFMKGRTDILDQLADKQAEIEQLETKCAGLEARIASDELAFNHSMGETREACAKVRELATKLKEIAVQSGVEGSAGGYNFNECRLCKAKVFCTVGFAPFVHTPDCLLFERTKRQD